MSPEELLRKFLPRFLDSANQRLVRADRLLATRTSDDARDLIRELHTVAGEAAVIGLPKIASAAHRAERLAHSWHVSMDPAVAGELRALLGELSQAVAALEPPDASKDA